MSVSPSRRVTTTLGPRGPSRGGHGLGLSGRLADGSRVLNAIDAVAVKVRPLALVAVVAFPLAKLPQYGGALSSLAA